MQLKRGKLCAVDRVLFSINRGEIFGLVGEYGSGKTVKARSINRPIPMPPGELVKGAVKYEGGDIHSMYDPEMRELGETNIAMVF